MILTRPVVLLLVTALGALANFTLLVPVVPLYAADNGAGPAAAGLTTGVMMLGTVLTELTVPRLLDRFGYRAVMAAGLALLGIPALALAWSAWLPVVLLVCLVRGAGLGIVVVAGAALSGILAPPGRRGTALALYGLAVTIPSIVCMPLGLWLVGAVGYPPVFLAAAGVAVLVIPAVAGLPGRTAPGSKPAGGVLAALRDPALARPAVTFAAATFAFGVTLTFVPLAVTGPGHVAAVALLVQSATTPLGRWLAGWHGDRHGSGRLLMPGIAVAAAGMAGLVWIGVPAVVVGAVAVFGFGLGIAQNASLAVMFDRVPAADIGRASALWNLAFDAGMGIGAVGFGVLADYLSYPVGFGITAAILVAALVPAWWDVRAGPRPSPG